MNKELQPQLSEDAKEHLKKQQYRVVGSHSVVKTCGWTKNMIKGIGGCYKLKFYGIMSNQCLQMSPSVSCANRCTFCWRDYKSPVSKEWKWQIDEPEFILNESLIAHHKLLEGYNQSGKSNQNLYDASKEVKHVALSLTGEPIIYPKINELIELFNKNKISTFLVTNAQYPDEIRNLAPVTQLYLSVDAPNKEMLKKIDNPLFKDYWERLLESLKEMSKKSQRTCIRLTIIKGVNDSNLEDYSKLINIGNPDFIEVKSYMHVGASRQRYTRANIARINDINKFAQELLKHLPDYEYVTDYKYSDVCLIAKKKFKIDNKWHTWIDFDKFNKLVNSGKEFTSLDYVRKTPLIRK
jgi:tRNA wybutosine-synthesizing protein 1